MKHQAKCYRNIDGVLYENYCDLVMTDSENEAAIAEAKRKYRRVKKIKHPKGYYQLFVGILE